MTAMIRGMGETPNWLAVVIANGIIITAVAWLESILVKTTVVVRKNAKIDNESQLVKC